MFGWVLFCFFDLIGVFFCCFFALVDFFFALVLFWFHLCIFLLFGLLLAFILFSYFAGVCLCCQNISASHLKAVSQEKFTNDGDCIGACLHRNNFYVFQA